MKIYLHLFLALLALALWAPSAHAAPNLTLPIDCDLESDCWLVNFMDTDKTPDTAQDFMCGTRTYDGHKGTDIAIRDLVTMETGINVLAAASGKILRIRDGVEDEVLTREELDKINAENRGCGNGVFIDHGDGWQTIYCHMKKDSIKVKQGQTVKQGDILGQVGHSGFVEFPHVHLGLFFESTPIDPFTGLDDDSSCRQNIQADTLWNNDNAPEYKPFSLYSMGFQENAPNFDALKIDATSLKYININASALVFWAGLFGVRQGDKITLEIYDPLGRLFAKRELIQDRNRARQFYYLGKRTNVQPLNSGTYKGIIHIYRALENTAPIIEKHEINIPVR